jgi:hypothetical protein
MEMVSTLMLILIKCEKMSYVDLTVEKHTLKDSLIISTIFIR